jgi:hypothetical protein
MRLKVDLDDLKFELIGLEKPLNFGHYKKENFD